MFLSIYKLLRYYNVTFFVSTLPTDGAKPQLCYRLSSNLICNLPGESAHTKFIHVCSHIMSAFCILSPHLQWRAHSLYNCDGMIW